MSFSKEEQAFIRQADKFIVDLPFGQWTSTLEYSNPDLFQALLKEYEKVYKIEYDNSLRNFRKIRQII